MTTAHPEFRVLSLLEADAVSVGDDGPEWVPVRRRLDIGAFGTNAYRARAAGDVVVEDHEESPGQEELYVVVRGRAEFRIGGAVVEAGHGSAVLVADPGTRRGAVALEDGTVVLAVGGWRDQPYRSLPWEPIYLAGPFMRRGDWAGAAETLEREAGEHLGSAFVQFRLACLHARLGEHDRALEELRAAVSANPAMLRRAADEEALAPLRELPGWPAGGRA